MNACTRGYERLAGPCAGPSLFPLNGPSSVGGEAECRRICDAHALDGCAGVDTDGRTCQMKMRCGAERSGLLRDKAGGVASCRRRMCGWRAPTHRAQRARNPWLWHRVRWSPQPKMYWFHPPKTGTSFATTLLLHAQPALPTNTMVHHELVTPHPPVSATHFQTFKGQFFGMFRQPEARVLSAYNYFRKFYAVKMSLGNYAHRVRGTVVKMLAGQGADANCCHLYPTPTPHHPSEGNWTECKPGCPDMTPNVPLAMERFEDAFAFVGITEEWALSICLFHVMFGGKCLGTEFINMRPGPPSRKRRPRTASSSDLRSGREPSIAANSDEYDGALYRRAVQRFRADLSRHDVTPRRCQHICPRPCGGGMLGWTEA